MKAKTVLLLYNLLWTVDVFARPSYRNLDNSFESWAYRNGFLRQIHLLEAEGFVESRKTEFKRKRVVRLTEAGRLAALGGRDPEQMWANPWDKIWRLVMFDLPAREGTLRKKLHRSLASAGCGCLQGSVWISPRPVPEKMTLFENPGTDCSHLMLLEAASKGVGIDRRMVQAAWPFGAINAAYDEHLAILKKAPSASDGASAFLEWSSQENEAWLAAVSLDPLLPSELHPRGYRGKRAWAKRKKVLHGIGKLADSLVPEGSRTG